MPDPIPGPCRATATIAFARVADCIDPILASIATHDMRITPEGASWRVEAVFGRAWLQPQPGALTLRVETADAVSLNRMKHALAGPIGFIAASEKLEIRWVGDAAGLVPLDDLRVLRVVQVSALTPRLRRIVLQGEDLGHLDRPDQMHCRLIFAARGEAAPVWPMLDDDGRVAWPGGKMPTRVYTLRAVDPTRGQVTIDFALHAAAGPATTWAEAACPGDAVAVVGPAAGGPIAASFHVLFGDETGLPGIARMLESLAPDARGHAFIEVQDEGEILALSAPPGIALQWLLRGAAPAGTTTLLQQAVRGVAWPRALAEVFVWGGCEYRAFRDIHRFLKQEVGLDRARQVLYSHWHRTLSEEQIIEIGGAAYLPE
ncbi:siderophore-interacting protein [Bordetella genomosp. 1]|uniref:Siderophore-interacting protein n=1 Tax=Bordetella genomosp. 1 TaxID=1395607 RepID=A0ABX4EW62_9BORD|nr:siderophore-interacting protein [Bordetella genomosp. 1]OZI58618.1 siderophore-interacting protein [Bordetella genomosp. 1]